MTKLEIVGRLIAECMEKKLWISPDSSNIYADDDDNVVIGSRWSTPIFELMGGKLKIEFIDYDYRPNITGDRCTNERARLFITAMIESLELAVSISIEFSPGIIDDDIGAMDISDRSIYRFNINGDNYDHVSEHYVNTATARSAVFASDPLMNMLISSLGTLNTITDGD